MLAFTSPFTSMCIHLPSRGRAAVCVPGPSLKHACAAAGRPEPVHACALAYDQFMATRKRLTLTDRA
eukprot:1147322-Pelagomonas_calceolata.AAC.10